MTIQFYCQALKKMRSNSQNLLENDYIKTANEELDYTTNVGLDDDIDSQRTITDESVQSSGETDVEEEDSESIIIIPHVTNSDPA